MPLHRHHCVRALFTACLAAAPLTAQCDPIWSPPSSYPGVQLGQAQAIHRWDPDGAGPATPKLVIGGSFAGAGSSYGNNLVVHDEAAGSWQSLGPAPDGTVHAIATDANGNLVVAGEFTSIGGIAANRIARWDGAAWTPLGTGTNAVVRALLLLQSGELLVGGDFTVAGGVAASRLARVTAGGAWSAGMSAAGVGFSGDVCALLQTPGGDVYVGGRFTQVSTGGLSYNRVARWNGSTWLRLQQILFAGMNGDVLAIAQRPNGDVVFGGSFTSAGGVSAWGVASYDGTEFDNLGAGLSRGLFGACAALTVLASGDVVAGGDFALAGGSPASRVARWNGSTWSAMAAGLDDDVLALLALPNGDVVAGGAFLASGAVAAAGLARFTANAWSPLAPDLGCNGAVYAMAVAPNGDLVVAGSMTVLDGVAVAGVARWNGTTWQALGDPAAGIVTTRLQDVVVLPTGDVVVTGFDFTNYQSNFVRRWDGLSWSDVGPAFNVPPETLAVLPDGSLVAGGGFLQNGGQSCQRVARWNGVSWQQLGQLASGYVACLEVLADGTLAAGGNFLTSLPSGPTDLAFWNGVGWQGLSVFSGVGRTVQAIAELANGDLVVGGLFTAIDGVPIANIARWSGGVWSPLGAGTGSTVWALWQAPQGELVVGGSFSSAGGVSARGIARWNGGSWSDVAGSLADVNGAVYAMAPFGNRLFVGGLFATVGVHYGRNLARLSNTCSAVSAAYGSGCAGSNGIDTLVETAPALIGSSFAARGTGLPSFGLVLAVTGLAPIALPLDVVFGPVATGCTLFAPPDILGTYVLPSPTFDSTFPLGNDPGLIGVSFLHQLVSLGLDVTLQVTEMTATNALLVTIGTL